MHLSGWLRALFTLKILSHCSEPIREGQFGRWLCPLQSAIRISMTQNLQCGKSSQLSSERLLRLNSQELIFTWLANFWTLVKIPTYNFKQIHQHTDLSPTNIFHQYPSPTLKQPQSSAMSYDKITSWLQKYFVHLYVFSVDK